MASMAGTPEDPLALGHLLEAAQLLAAKLSGPPFGGRFCCAQSPPALAQWVRRPGSMHTTSASPLSILMVGQRSERRGDQPSQPTRPNARVNRRDRRLRRQNSAFLPADQLAEVLAREVNGPVRLQQRLVIAVEHGPRICAEAERHLLPCD